MSYEIVRDRLVIDGDRVPFVRSPNQGGRITPTCIVIHDTADRPTTTSDSVNWFRKRKAQVSAHFVLGRKGDWHQCVDCDRKAYHAGKSKFKGRKYVNGFGIGIEVDNPGKLVGSTERAQAWFDGSFSGDDYELEERRTREHGHGIWMAYTDEQVESVIAACKALVAAYPTIKDITTHYEISPRRKVDCNPLFPLKRVREAVFGHTEPESQFPLAIGSYSDDVRTAQSRLKKLGYGKLVVDGDFGPATRRAVLAWEAENGAETDGKLTEAELDALTTRPSKEIAASASEEKAASQKAQAKVEIGAAATATGATLVADATGIVDAGTVWNALSGVLTKAGEIISKISETGLTVGPRGSVAVILVLATVVLWRWSKKIS